MSILQEGEEANETEASIQKASEEEVIKLCIIFETCVKTLI